MENKWTKEEIETYQKDRDNNTQERLGPAYLNAGIPSNEPSKRTEYLKEKIKLIVTKEKYERILEGEKKFGKVNMLQNLERIAISNFF